jgi:malonyl CoA-acyl carrier protein transacylase
MASAAAEQFNQLCKPPPFKPLPSLSMETSQRNRCSQSPIALLRSFRNEMLAPVRWRESIHHMIRDGAQTFVEIGNGEVLSGLVKRIDNAVTRVVVQSAETLEAFAE